MSRKSVEINESSSEPASKKLALSLIKSSFSQTQISFSQAGPNSNTIHQLPKQHYYK